MLYTVKNFVTLFSPTGSSVCPRPATPQVCPSPPAQVDYLLRWFSEPGLWPGSEIVPPRSLLSSPGSTVTTLARSGVLFIHTDPEID
jgi:hypothetical protein